MNLNDPDRTARDSLEVGLDGPLAQKQIESRLIEAVLNTLQENGKYPVAIQLVAVYPSYVTICGVGNAGDWPHNIAIKINSRFIDVITETCKAELDRIVSRAKDNDA